MNKLIFFTLITAFFLVGCGKSSSTGNPGTGGDDDNESITFGSVYTLDILTWNLKEYPYKNSETVYYLKEMIPELKIDIIALQEIGLSFYNSTERESDYLDSLAAALGDFWICSQPQDNTLAFLINTESISNIECFEIYPPDSWAFPRPPLVLNCSWEGKPVTVINNHLKAYGDNIIEYDNRYDEEFRRLTACNYLAEYTKDFYSNKKVIILGDFNDRINDIPSANVFTAFKSDPDYFLIADAASLLENPVYSYPQGSTQLDHIIINNNLFDEISECRTIKAEEFLDDTIDDYLQYISDHRPVGVIIDFK